MPARNYKFKAGPTPNKVDDEGNGNWSARSTDADSAWRAILSSVTFPGEMTGRFEDVFVEGISLPGRRSEEVIQLWSDQPEIIERTADVGDRWVAENPPSSHHFAFPHRKTPWTCRIGLAQEIAVEDVVRYLIPVRPVPAGLALPAPGDQTALSPIGQLAVAGVSLEHRLKLYLGAQDARLRQVRSQLEISAAAGELNDRMRAMNRQLAVLNTYMHGMTAAELIHDGNRAPSAEPYHIFQSRLHLDQEIGLLVNLVGFDFRDVAALDEWLIASGHWRKLLPHSKTILVTRIRAQDKAYAGATGIQEMIWNYWNMQNLVWVRDGDFVFRFATDLHFDNAIFKSSNESDHVESVLRDAVYAQRFARKERDSTATVGLRDDAANVTTPYTRPTQVTGYPSVEAWMESEDYRPETVAAIREAARSYVEGCNIKRLPFLVLLQGMVDSTRILSIPPGTNLLDPLSIGRHFRLVYDKEGALADSTARDAYAELVKPERQKRGDWILARVSRDREINARFYEVVSSGEDGVTIRYTPTSTRWPYQPLKNQRTRKISRYLPASLPGEIVARLLDDRDWKINHPSLVPILAKWNEVQDYLAKGPENDGLLSLGHGLDVFQEEDKT